MMPVRDKQLNEATRIEFDLLSRVDAAMHAGANLDPRCWYAIQVRSQREKAVESALGDSGVECWIPSLERKPKRRAGRIVEARHAAPCPAFPGYLFARIEPTAENWHVVKACKGVLGLLGWSSRRGWISEATVLRLKSFLEEDPDAARVILRAMKVGDRVRLTDGPFASYPGVVQRVGDDGRALVELLVFGRATRFNVDLAQIEKSD